MKKRYIAFTVCFIFALLLPNLLYPVCRNYVDTTNYENRALAKRPSLRPSNLPNLPNQLTEYYSDHLPFKNQWAELNSLINLKLFHSVDSEDVLLGKDGRLFYKTTTDGNPIEDYLGVNTYTPEQLELIKDQLLRVRDYYESRSTEFVLFLAPNKERIYRDKMPDNIEPVNSVGRVEELIAYLRKETDLRIVYPKDELNEAALEEQIYYKYDTHWNAIGAFVGSFELLKELNRPGLPKDWRDCKINNIKPYHGDLCNKLKLQRIFNDDPYYEVEYKPEITYNLVKEETELYQEFESDAPNEQSIFVIRDSFSLGMRPFISKEYSQATFAHCSVFDFAQIEEKNPDVLVLEIVERYNDILLTFTPDLIPADK